MFGKLENVGRDIRLWEVCHRIAVGLEENQNIFAVGDPFFSETHTHSPAQWFYIQKSLRQRFRNEKAADRLGRERTLLP